MQIWTKSRKSDMPGPVQEDKYLLQTSGNTFIFSDFTPFHWRALLKAIFFKIFGLFWGFVSYFWDFWSNIQVCCQNNLIFKVLRQKWCRIIMKFRQNTISGPETWQIGPKVGNRTCPDLSRRTSTYFKPSEILLFFQILHLSIFY